MAISGVLLPIITPFGDGKIDYQSYKTLIDFYLKKEINGIIPNGTTGECPTIDDYEMEELLDKTIEYTDSQVPVYFGLGGNNTDKLVKKLKGLEKRGIKGILSVAPYYSRPDQRGIYEHFRKLSESTPLEIIIYNIPYRTGRNIENETLRKLALLKNITGLKDSCGDIKQTMDLLINRPENLSILTGEDILYYLTLTLGGDGGILAAAHVQTEKFIDIYKLMLGNNHRQALAIWKEISWFIPYLFEEPNPAPLKFILHQAGKIASDEVRLPLVGISDKMKQKLNGIAL
jgi:4-hydroxy-tetrahydrodipicolinate synthase